jgi:ubiquinone/menaquinone biosynthesis C-methylase UbiE
MDKARYPGARLLDMGFGDGRNWPLLHNSGFKIHGVEITDDIVALGRERARGLGIEAQLARGRNTEIPFERAYFEYILACHSCYYVDAGTTFDQALGEYARVLEPGGFLIASLPEATGQICQNAIDRGNGHFEITQDPWNLRNGYIFRVFSTKDEVRGALSKWFDCLAIGLCKDEFFGVLISFYIVVARRREDDDAVHR